MKKQFILSILIVFSTVTMFAQEDKKEESSEGFVSKKGINILPEAGEYSIGIDATPFFTYFGNMMNGNAANAAPAFGYTAAAPLTITGKLMADKNTAYRVLFRVGYNKDRFSEYVHDDVQPITEDVFVVDDRYVSEMNMALGLGLEKRRGKGRLQGIYGGQLIFTMFKHSEEYTYGNALSATNTSPTFYDWAAGAPTVATERITDSQLATNFGIMVQGFVGAEYFFAPKLSISGELQYGLGYNSQGEGYVNSEKIGSNGKDVVAKNIKTGSETHFSIDTRLSAAINLNFYF